MDELIRQLLETRARLVRDLEANLAAPTSEQRDLNETETARHTELRGQIAAVDERIADCRDQAARDAAAAELRTSLGIGDGPGAAPARTGAEERTYRRRGEHSYYRDLGKAAFGDFEARDRLSRHGQEVTVEARENPNGPEARALNTSNGTGGTFVPPVYLVEEYAPFARAGRPFADACARQELPAGTDSINVPKITGGTAAGPQAGGGQNAAVLETDITDNYVTAPVVTIAGEQTISLQLIEQSPVNFDEIIFRDLVAAYNQQLDVQVSGGAGTGGTHTGVLTIAGSNLVTFTSGTPTVAALYSKLANAVELIHTSRFMPPDSIWMHPRRWAWLLASVDSAGRPLVVPSAQGPYNVFGNQEGVRSEDGPVGTMQGLPVFVDANLPTNQGAGLNQDPILVMRMSDMWLWEGSLVSRALPQTLGGNLSVLLQVYAYSAFMAGRYPVSIAPIEGTGLTTPAF